jgi:uncharacterized protein (DUF952 family)
MGVFMLFALLMLNCEDSMEKTPAVLYKIISDTNWQKSQGRDRVVLDKMDDSFIHLARKDQLDSILKKFWTDQPTPIVLELTVDRLIGRLVYEKNPGGANRYYHLYEGKIPMNAVRQSFSGAGF